MTRTGNGEKTAVTEGILAKTVWVGTSWNLDSKLDRFRGGKPAGDCGENWPEPRVGEISQKWGGKLTRTERK